MKWVLLLSVLSATTFASEAVPLLRLERASGYVPSHMAYYQTCRVHARRVQTITRRAGNAPVTKWTPVRFTQEVPSLAAIRRLSEQAFRGTVATAVAPTDGPSHHHEAFRPNGSSVTLSQYYSGTRKENRSPAAQKLVRFLNANCKL